MLIRYLFISTLIVFFSYCSVVYSATSVTQHGITWTFDSDHTVGQFANGDYYVIGPTNITGISPGYTSSPRAKNGSMINPSSMPQGYDGAGYYSSSANVGIGISPSTPLVLQPGDSLVSTISVDTIADSNASYVKTAAVLTCLNAAPPSGTFRPGISGTTKTLHNKSSLNLSLLKKLANPPSWESMPASALTDCASLFQMVWLDHNADYTSRNMHPVDSGLDNYEFPIRFSECSLGLQLNYSDAEKDALLTNFVQMGIDLYSYLESGGIGWLPNGGHSSGRKWPILFSGIMLNYAPMKNIGQLSGNYLYSNGHGPENAPSDYKYFSEDDQVFYVTQSDIDITNGGGWNPDVRNHTPARYTSAMLGMPEWGIRHATNPEYSDSSWLAKYRPIKSCAPAWSGTTLAARIMGAKSLWNYDAHFDYVDRYVAIAKGLPDPFGYTVTDEQSVQLPSEFILSMFNTYRNYNPGTKYKNVKSITQD
jgi:hypothetical protein